MSSAGGQAVRLAAARAVIIIVLAGLAVLAFRTGWELTGIWLSLRS